MRCKRLVAFSGALLMSLSIWGVSAGEQAKGGPDHLAKEEEKHLKRLATIDRLEELAKELKNDALLEKIKMLRENEQRRFDRASERMKRPHGKSGDSEKGGKKGDEDKAAKGKPDEKAGGGKEGNEGREEHGRQDEKERSEKGKEGAAEGKGKPEEKEKDETKAKHGKSR